MTSGPTGFDFLHRPEYHPSVRGIEQLAACLEADGPTPSVPWPTPAACRPLSDPP
ncbi:MAG TPA: hypothetical protein VG412_00730 [Acidimicrobiales bacterium]|nr:hypothetical protein [Acidimicrobiales bacterium]